MKKLFYHDCLRKILEAWEGDYIGGKKMDRLKNSFYFQIEID